MSDLKIGVMGVGGRMGRELVAAIQATPGVALAAGLEQAGAATLGQDIGVLAGGAAIGITVGSDPADFVAAVDAILDFTAPSATVAMAKFSAKRGIVHIIGTTGCAEADDAAIAAAGQRARIVKAGNMCLGVNLLTRITERIAAALDADYDIEIVEMHHRMKVDAPSGTALMLGEAAARGRKVSLAGASVRTRDGHTGARRRGDIGFQALRGGTVIGDHTVIFAADGERIEITHRANDRGIYARGAVKAALWARDQPAGLYTMADVLGL
jgi:4-hydroxy-tetrahydrodipicolinate reductase